MKLTKFRIQNYRVRGVLVKKPRLKVLLGAFVVWTIFTIYLLSFLLADSSLPPEQADAGLDGRFAADGWIIVGVWEVGYGLPQRQIMEESDGRYRIRWDEENKNTNVPLDAGFMLEKKDNMYISIGSCAGDYFKIRSDGRLASFDDEGPIRISNPVE